MEKKNNFNLHFQKIVKKNKYKIAITDLKNKEYTYDYLNKKSDYISSFLFKKLLIESSKDIEDFIKYGLCVTANFEDYGLL